MKEIDNDDSMAALLDPNDPNSTIKPRFSLPTED
jgi:hypothetical protein